jgi:hypothetical protein
MMPGIRITPKRKGDKLHQMSRIDFARMYTVEHNVKVYEFGEVHRDALDRLIKQWFFIIQDGIRSHPILPEVPEDEDDQEQEGSSSSDSDEGNINDDDEGQEEISGAYDDEDDDDDDDEDTTTAETHAAYAAAYAQHAAYSGQGSATQHPAVTAQQEAYILAQHHARQQHEQNEERSGHGRSANKGKSRKR